MLRRPKLVWTGDVFELVSGLFYDTIYNTRNELASLAHSFYTCLKPPHSSDDCILQVFIYTLGP